MNQKRNKSTIIVYDPMISLTVEYEHPAKAAMERLQNAKSRKTKYIRKKNVRTVFLHFLK